jgi:transaldolase
MQFFVDSADVKAIEKLIPLGVVDGVTTNPSLMAQSGRPMKDVLTEICALVPGPVSAEVTATDLDGMLKEGEYLAGIAKNIVIKVPLTTNGLMACHRFRRNGIAVNVTLCFSLAQALLAAKAGATYVSPFLGRLDDLGQDGLALLEDIVLAYGQYDTVSTQILAASIRSPYHVTELAKMGVDVVTVPPKVIEQLVHHPLTDKGIDMFLKDWAKTGQSIL